MAAGEFYIARNTKTDEYLAGKLFRGFYMTPDVTNALKTISKDYGITIVMISHNTDFIKELSNRALFMDDGKIIDDSEDIDEIVDNFIDFCHADYLKGDN